MLDRLRGQASPHKDAQRSAADLSIAKGQRQPGGSVRRR